MLVRLEISETDIKRLVHDEILRRLGGSAPVGAAEKIRIETKSKQNYRSEWEIAAFRAIFEGDV